MLTQVQQILRTEGRLNRAPLWFFAIALGVLQLATEAGIAQFLGLTFWELLSLSGTENSHSVPPWQLMLLIWLLHVAFTVPLTTLSIRRLHDRNSSGWWVIPFIILPSLILLADEGTGGFGGSTTLSRFSVIGAFAFTVWGFVELYCLRGTMGENQYGPDPLNPVIPEQVFE